MSFPTTVSWGLEGGEAGRPEDPQQGPSSQGSLCTGQAEAGGKSQSSLKAPKPKPYNSQALKPDTLSPKPESPKPFQNLRP